MTRLKVNGVDLTATSPPMSSLLTVLRDELQIRGPKAGCEQGGCGTCTVLVNGEPRRSCLLALHTVADAEITTVEGLGAPEELSELQKAFQDGYAAQCGFCTGGMLLAATALLSRHDGPVDRHMITDALGGHFCRCTGYVKILAAVEAASRAAGPASSREADSGHEHEHVGVGR